MLLAEELLLLVLDDETGRASGASSHLRPALGGALLAELPLAERGVLQRREDKVLGLVPRAAPTDREVVLTASTCRT